MYEIRTFTSYTYSIPTELFYFSRLKHRISAFRSTKTAITPIFVLLPSLNNVVSLIQIVSVSENK